MESGGKPVTERDGRGLPLTLSNPAAQGAARDMYDERL
jgi:hypothetical protein